MAITRGQLREITADLEGATALMKKAMILVDNATAAMGVHSCLIDLAKNISTSRHGLVNGLSVIYNAASVARQKAQGNPEKVEGQL